MKELTESENKFIERIKDSSLKTTLSLIREASGKLWKEDRIVSFFTNHGVEHFLRLIDYASQLDEANLGTHLTQQEIFILLSGIYLHDAGMQCDVKRSPELMKIAGEDFGAKFTIEFEKAEPCDKKTCIYSEEEQQEIRKNHHLLTAAMIRQAWLKPDKSDFSVAIRRVPQDLIEDIIDVCRFHSGDNFNECDELSKRSKKIRKKLIAALVRLSDELDVGSNRVDMETARRFSIPLENIMYWWLHNNTKVEIDGNEIILKTFLKQEDYDRIHGFVSKNIIRKFEEKNSSIFKVLKKNNFPCHISDSSTVSVDEYSDKFPEEVIEFIKEQNSGNKQVTINYAQETCGFNEIDSQVISNNKIITEADNELLKPEDPDREIIGRENDINKVADFLNSEKNMMIFHGPPGIGKTEVCRQGIKRWLETGKEEGKESSIVYVNLFEANTFDEFLMRISEALGITHIDSSEKLKQVIKTKNTIYYLDNLEDIFKVQAEGEKIVRFIKEIRRNSKILASCREEIKSIGGYQEKIDVLDEVDAIKFFTNESIRCNPNAMENLRDEGEKLKDFVTDKLKCHPLSIIVTAPLYDETDGGIEKLNQLWDKKWNELSNQFEFDNRKENNLEVSIALSLDRLKSMDNSSGALKLWNIMIFFPEGLSYYSRRIITEIGIVKEEDINILKRLNLIGYEKETKKTTMLPFLLKYAENAADKKEGFDIDKGIQEVYPLFVRIAVNFAMNSTQTELHKITFQHLIDESSNMNRFINFCLSSKKDHSIIISTIHLHISDYYQFKPTMFYDSLSKLISYFKVRHMIQELSITFICIGVIQIRLGKFEKARKYFEGAIALFKRKKDNSGLAIAFANLGDLENRLGNIEEAKRRYKKATELFTSEQYDLGLANTYQSIGELENRLGNIVEARGKYEDAIKLYKKEQHKLGLANAYQSIGELENRLGNIEEAKTKYDEAVKLFKAEQDNLGLANTYRSIGNIEDRLGNIEEARKKYDEAAEIYKAEQDNLGLANAYQSIGNIEKRLGNIEEAKTKYDEAVKLYKAEQDNLGLANAYKSIGDLEDRLGNIEEARKKYDEAVELFKAEQNNLGLANAYQSIGNLENRLGNIEEAKIYYEKAEPLFLTEQNNEGFAYNSVNFALLDDKNGNNEKAQERLEKALEAAERSSIPYAVAYSLKAISKISQIPIEEVLQKYGEDNPEQNIEQIRTLINDIIFMNGDYV